MALSFSFDAMGQYETPILTLCNPQGDQLDIMGQVQDLVYTPAFNGLSELSLRIPKAYTDADGPKEIPYYDKTVKNRLILAEGIGWFVIDSEKEQNDGMSVYKEIQASSYEVTLNRLETNIPDGTHQFYSAASPGSSLMGMVAALLPDWSIGRISTDLWTRYRTFEIDNSTPLYSFLMEEVEEAYECIFDFDTLNKTISAYTPEEAVETTDIFLSLDNLVKVVNVETTSDPLITALSVTGDDSLDITLVNPMGTTMMYDFSYFKDPKWMSEALIAALDKWEAKFQENQPKYADLLSQYKDKNSQLVTLRSELVDLESAYAALETTRTEYIAQGQTDLRSITSQIESNKTARKNKQAEIDRAQTDLQNLHNSLSAISQSLQFENNFSDEELRELHHFMHSDTYQNSNFSVTESMDPMEQQELAQELYDQGINILHKLCQPNYTFSLEMVNFLMLPEFQPFIRQTQLGRTVNVEIRDGLWFKPVLLKAEIHYDDPVAMKLTFSNKLRLDDAAWTLEELLGEATKTSNKVSYSGLSWKKAAEQTDIVTEYMKNALDLANQHIQNNNNQEILINEYGIWGTRLEDDGSVSPEQMKLQNNMMAYTRNNWQTAEAAFGKIKSPYENDDNEYYGLIAPAIVGNLMAGNELIITNNGQTFRVDGNGVTLIDADLTLTSTKTKSKILMNTDVGFQLTTDSGSSFTIDTSGNVALNDFKLTLNSSNNVSITLDPNSTYGIRIAKDGTNLFTVDNNGNLVLRNIDASGTITSQSGNIGGWEITSEGLKSGSEYILSTGYGKLGLMTYTPSYAEFKGNIYAKNLNLADNNDVQQFQDHVETVVNNAIKNISNSSDWLDIIKCKEIHALGDAEKAIDGKLYADTGEILLLGSNYILSELVVAVEAMTTPKLDVSRINGGTGMFELISSDSLLGEVVYCNDFICNNTVESLLLKSNSIIYQDHVLELVDPSFWDVGSYVVLGYRKT